MIHIETKYYYFLSASLSVLQGPGKGRMCLPLLVASRENPIYYQIIATIGMV
jgi:hypothetical protein